MYRKAWGCNINLLHLFKLFDYNLEYAKEHKNEFKPHGILVFSGEQGSGKTLTAVRYIKLCLNQYPKAKVVSNVNINGVDTIRYQGLHTLLETDNGSDGIIFFCDEISNQFSSLDSKEISSDWFTILNMQRKRHLHIVGTCPVLGRVMKPFREQFSVICTCEQLFGGYVQNNHYYKNTLFAFSDGQDITKGLKHLKWQFFTVCPEHYFSYDSFEVVQVVKEQKKEGVFYGYF